MASNRYASHLSGCIGIGTGTRRGAARGATSKSKYVSCFFLVFFLVLARFDHSDTFLFGTRTGRRLGSDAGRSASPYPASENGNASDHNAPPPPPPGPKKKGRPPKNKPKRMCCAAGGSFTFVVRGDTQRPALALVSPHSGGEQRCR